MQDPAHSSAGDHAPGGGDKEAANPDPKTTLAGHRTNFAMFRTSLALDRTTLAWVRTGLTFASFGFGMVGFFRSAVQATHTEQSVRLHQGAIRIGVALIVTGMVATILTAISHWMTLRKLRGGTQVTVAKWPLSITIALFVAILCLYALWSAFAP
jgi:putative membrane protein